MREPQAKTKVVIRQLPANVNEDVVLEAVNKQFAGRYNWFSFYAGNARRNFLSRAYINFKKAEDVFDFSEAFQGHIFVNERGVPFRAAVEYAPFQRVPKQRSRKDPKEGTLLKDDDYLQFVAALEKPVESLPSAEVQLERKEAEKASSGATKEPVVVTPLMDFVRQKRLAKLAPSSREKLASGGAKQAVQGRAGAPSPSAASSQQRRVQHDKARHEAEKASQESSQHGPLPAPTGKDEPRAEREGAAERRRREAAEAQAHARDRKLAREAMASALGSSRASKATPAAPASNGAGAGVGSAAAARAAAAAALAGTPSPAEAAHRRDAGQAAKLRGAEGKQDGQAQKQAEHKASAAGAAAGSKTQSEPEDTQAGGGPSGGRGGARRDPLPRKQQRHPHAGKAKEQAGAGEAAGGSSPRSGSGTGGGGGQAPQGEQQRQGTAAAEMAISDAHGGADPPLASGPYGRREAHRGPGPQQAREREQQSRKHPQASSQQAPQARQVPQEGVGGRRGPSAGAGPEAGARGRESAEGGAAHEASPAAEPARRPSLAPGSSAPGPPPSDRGEQRRLRNKDRPDRPVWTPRRRGDPPPEGTTASPTPQGRPGADHPGAGGALLSTPSASADAGQAEMGPASGPQPARGGSEQHKPGGRSQHLGWDPLEGTSQRADGTQGPSRKAALAPQLDAAATGGGQAGAASHARAVERGHGKGQRPPSLGSLEEQDARAPRTHAGNRHGDALSGRPGGGKGPRGGLVGGGRSSRSPRDGGSRAAGAVAEATALESTDRSAPLAAEISPPGDATAAELPLGGTAPETDRRAGQRPVRRERGSPGGHDGGPGGGERPGRRVAAPPQAHGEKQVWMAVQRPAPSP